MHFKITFFYFCFLICASLGCATESENESVDSVDNDDRYKNELESEHLPLLGDLTVQSGCTAAERAIITDWAFVARVVLSSEAFLECIDQRVRNDYIHCSSEKDASSIDRHIKNASIVAQNINDLEIDCDDVSGGNATAGVGDFANYDIDKLTFHKWLNNPVNQLNNLSDPNDDARNRFAPFPWPTSQGAGIIVHEAMHQQNYSHWPPNSVSFGSCFPDSGASNRACTTAAQCNAGEHCETVTSGGTTTGFCATYKRHQNSMPYIVGGCVSEVIERSETNCGICPTRAADDLSSCRNRGRLSLVETFNSPPAGYVCRQYFDPGIAGIGLLNFDGSKLKAVDMLKHGQRFGGVDWRNGENDAIVGAGDIWPYPANGADEFIVKSGWGIGVIGYNPAENEPFQTVDLKPYGQTLPHFGDGSGTWTLNSNDQVIAADKFSNTSQYGESAYREEILIKGNSGIGIINVYGNEFRTRNMIPWETKINGPYGHWALNSTDEIVGVGDFNGDGQADILVKSDWGVAVLSRTDSSGSFRTIEIHPYGRAGSWNWRANNEIVAIGDFDGDSTDDILIRSNWGLGYLGFGTNQRFTSYWLGPWGTQISATWTLNINDHFGDLVRTLSYKDSILIQGNDGIAVVNFTSSEPFYPFILGNQYYENGSRIPSTGEGHWGVNPTDELSSAGDLDGDGIGDMLISSGWGMAIIGLSTTDYTIRVRTIKQYNCGDANDDACHGNLWGSWLVREYDERQSVITGDNGKEIMIMRSFPYP